MFPSSSSQENVYLDNKITHSDMAHAFDMMIIAIDIPAKNRATPDSDLYLQIPSGFRPIVTNFTVVELSFFLSSYR
jgi:hypothetical protein